MAFRIYSDFIGHGNAPDPYTLLIAAGGNYYIKSMVLSVAQIVATGNIFLEYGLLYGATYFYKNAVITVGAGTFNNLQTTNVSLECVLPRASTISFQASFFAPNLTNVSYYLDLYGTNLA